MTTSRTATVAELAARVGGRVIGDPNQVLDGVARLEVAGATQVGFVRDARYADRALASSAGAVLVCEDLELPSVQIVVDDVGMAFAMVAQFFHPRPCATESAIHPSAVIEDGAEIQEPVEIGPHCTVRAGARIGAGTVLGASCSIGRDAVLGENVVLCDRVTVYDQVKLGNRVTIQSGTVIGSDGFGYAPFQGQWALVPQVGIVELGDDVDLGANCTVDRGALGPTVIGRGTKIDNLVHIAHNCVIGEDCVIAALCALAGSTILGDRVTIGGHVLCGGHLSIGDEVRIGGNSVLTKSVSERGDYMGYPLMPKRRFAKHLNALRHLVDWYQDRRDDQRK